MKLKYIIEICVAIDIAIIGIAYPIIIDKISNIGNKYSSNYLPNIFASEFPQLALGPVIPYRTRSLTWFEWLLFSTIISFIFLILDAEPWIFKDSAVMQNSAKILVLILSVFLVIFFIIWLDKIALFMGKPTTLLLYLIKKYRTHKKEDQFKTYLRKTLNEFAYFSIEKEDEHLQEILRRFYAEEFVEIRKNHSGGFPLEYPFDLYDLTRKLIKKHLRKDYQEIDRLSSNAISNWWVLGQDHKEIPISETTYDWMWGNIVLISSDAKLVIKHWGIAHQYYSFQLGNKSGIYNKDLRAYENQDEIDLRKSEQLRFLEFHFAKGGLLLYKENLKGIKRILNYTQSQPPDYCLLPDSMYEIFYWFAYFKEGYVNRVTPTDFKYPFPDIDNLGLSRQITFWICKYIALLFIRLYTLQPNYTYQNFTDQPVLPDEVLQLLKWQDSISYFVLCLEKVMEKEELLSELGFTIIVQENRDQFETFIRDLRKNIDHAIVQNRLQAPISEEKEQQFKDSSAELIDKAFIAYDEIVNNKDFDENTSVDRFGLYGSRILTKKEGFTDGDIPHLNYDTVFAQQIIYGTINRFIPNSFLTARTRSYLIERVQIQEALNKLNYNADIHVIVGVGFLDFMIDKSTPFLRDIKKIPSTFFDDVLFILPKSDLPIIKHIDLQSKEIDDLGLDLIVKDKLIYASLIDLTLDENEDLRHQWNLNENENPAESVQLTISFIAHIIWKQQRDVVQLNFVSPLREQGIQNEINEITPF